MAEQPQSISELFQNPAFDLSKGIVASVLRFPKLLKTLNATGTTLYLIALDKADGRTQNISASEVLEDR